MTVSLLTLTVEWYLCPLTNTKNKNTYYNAVSLQVWYFLLLFSYIKISIWQMLCASYQYLCLFMMIVKNRKNTWCLNFIEIICNASLSHKDKNIQCFKQFWNWRLQIFNSFSCNFWFQSFTIPDRFISAQFPLPDYTEDFLRLVEAYYTPTIVSLCPLMEVESV